MCCWPRGITSNVRDPVAQWVGVPASDPEAPGSSPTPGLDVQGRGVGTSSTADMADWQSHFRNKDEEDPEEAEENEEDVRYAGRDSLVFLIDASEAMFEMNGEATSAFDMTIQCVHRVYTSKIISSDRDLLAVVFFGTQKHKNSVDFKHVYVLHDLDTPGAKRVLELDQYEGEKGNKSFKKNIGHSADDSLSDALWVCSNLFSDVTLKLSHKRIMLFTNNDNPHAKDSSKARLTRTKANDLRETGIILDLMHLKKPGGFDMSLFYCDIVSVSEDGDAAVQGEGSARLDDLLRKVWDKDYKKRTVTRLNLKLGEGVELSIGVYNLVRCARKPSAVRLYRESNEPVKTKTRWFNGATGSLLLPSDTKKAQVYGQRQIVLEKEETEELKRFDGPGLVLIGFKPLSLLKKHHHIRPPQFIYPDEMLITAHPALCHNEQRTVQHRKQALRPSKPAPLLGPTRPIVCIPPFPGCSCDYPGSTTLFSALLTKCLEKDVYAVCRYTPRRNTAPRFVALVPQEEALDDQKVQTIPPGFHLIYLPYADDVRKIGFMEKRVASEDQIEKMKSVVQKLRFKYRPESFENPVIQRHFRNLEALALDLKEPEEVEDLTRDAAGGAEKKPNVEVSLGKEEVRQYLRSGTLGKLTVPVLKEVCKQYGLRGSKKQELIDAITGHFAEN
ncbi:X-ray repair cross-complementing protein 6-like isoform X1 [Mustelus asterias]